MPAARIVDPSLIPFSGLPSAGKAFSQPLEGVSWVSFPWARTRPAQNKKRALCRLLELTAGYLIVMVHYILQPVVKAMP